ncbi:electron transport complex subunit RsxC [Candidatus Haliotispira prima]|uniref:Ion-translocating oxidoreductase complex subunit C n=1 Tax=Candidatus Haliotispira prima TaxID=3034016 RepID=A0ABY8ME72_9SPIO|nr:electron transport complex subunit RsxC [Candidatus Haliotispira prima]
MPNYHSLLHSLSHLKNTLPSLAGRAPGFTVGGFLPPAHEQKFHAGKPSPIEYIDNPAKTEISLLQHIGPVAKPLVDIGEHVHSGQLIAQTGNMSDGELKQNFLYSRIHSPIDGIVTAIESHTLANGLKAESIVIEYETLPGNPAKPAAGRNHVSGRWRGKGHKEILERVAEAGIVGMGGATFPTDIKLHLPINRRCDYLLLNAVECEPYLRSDTGLLEEMAFDVIGGIDILAECLKPKHIVIGLEKNQSWVLPLLKEAIRNYRAQLKPGDGSRENSIGLLPPIRIAILRTRYPQGAERQLVEAVSGREVPPGKLPSEVGCIVINISTGKAIYDALERGLPLTRRIVTVGGGAVRSPKVFNAPLGTPLSDLLDRCGGLDKPVARMMNGGPMMGTSFYDFRQFVTKGSAGFLFLTAEEIAQKKERPCIRCDACIQVCPMGLEPTAMYKHILAEETDSAERIGLMNCIECGACASVCPSQIPLTQGFRMGKVRWHLQQQNPENSENLHGRPEDAAR